LDVQVSLKASIVEKTSMFCVSLMSSHVMLPNSGAVGQSWQNPRI